MYLDFIVLGQLLPAANVNPEIDLDSYVLKDNEVIMYCPVYNKSTGMYGGLTRKLGYITLPGGSTTMVSIKKKALCFIVT